MEKDPTPAQRDARLAKQIIKTDLPDLMVGICDGKDGDCFVEVRIAAQADQSEDNTQELVKSLLPKELEYVKIRVVSVGKIALNSSEIDNPADYSP